jgi:hypothetical protein
MNPSANVAGLAALSICESLLLALSDHKTLSEWEILGILRDAADSHANVPEASDAAHFHAEVAAVIRKIIARGNSVRRT